MKEFPGDFRDKDQKTGADDFMGMVRAKFMLIERSESVSISSVVTIVILLMSWVVPSHMKSLGG
jgi:hypothetical protein